MPGESKLEAKLKTGVESKGGLCLKFVSPGTNGVVDRLILMPGGKYHIAELKFGKNGLSPVQVQHHKKLTRMGFTVELLPTEEAVINFLNKL